MESHMEVFLYSSEIEGKEKEIESMMEKLLPAHRLDVLRSIDNLSKKLQEAWKERPIVVILAHKIDELIDLVSIREQLHAVRLILILPDAEEGTISLAHRLRPNYLTYFHRGVEELKAVLEKMMMMN